MTDHHRELTLLDWALQDLKAAIDELEDDTSDIDFAHDEHERAIQSVVRRAQEVVDVNRGA